MKKLPIQKEYEGSVCEIKSMDNQLIAIGKIKEVDIDSLRISNSKKEMHLVDYGTPIKINIFNTKLGFRVLVGTVYTSTRIEMTINSIYNLVEGERRNFFRVDMNIPASVFYKKNLTDDFPTETNIVVLDMSLSGLKFKSKCEFKEDMLLTVEVSLSDKKNSAFQCRILRTIDSDDKYNYYGCEFVYSKSEDADLLCSYLFKKQREFLSQREY